jgi:hypothetical protein
VDQPHRFPTSLATALLVLVLVAVATPRGASAQSFSSITVTVQFVVLSGVQPAPGRGEVSPRTLPAAGITTWVVPAGGPLSPPGATATTDTSGVASFTLPAGSYWVVVPRLASPPPAVPGAAVTTELPDGTLVQGWTPVELAAEASADVTIRLTVPLP